MQPTSNLPPDNTPVTSSNLKRNLAIGGIILAIIVFQFFSWQSKNTKPEEQKIEKKEPLFHRDEPVKEQIFQEDYVAKVHEMLDSGKSVMVISRETGIRIDVVRKIKNKKGKEKQ